MRLPALAVVTVVAAALGGGAALGIGKGTGWLDQGTKTVVVRAEAAGPVSLPASATSKASPLSGKGFDPQRIFADRSAGVVTIFAYFGDPGSRTPTVSQGSGFVISPRGYVLTNSHVITNAGDGSPVKAADHLFVEFADGDRAEATVVGWDLYDDVGLLRLDPALHRLSTVPLGESAAVVVGEPVAAIGSPLGNENTLTVGVVSAIHRSINALTVRIYNIVDAIQTDAPITHGNSGGPLFDARGRVIGINAQIRTNGAGNDSGIGFAVPIDAAKHSVAQLLAKGKVTYAYVGISTENLTPSLARALGYKVDHGALIVNVNGGSPAESAGLHGGAREANVLGRTVETGGDVIVAIDGKPVNGADDVVRFVSLSLRPKDVAVLTIVKPGGQRKKVAVTLAERKLPTAG
jgi:S1-C subfamily serine protease